MLSKEENELLAQTGPGTAMGDLMRRYWLPALLSEELPERDGTPLKLRLLGEDLVAFRDTEGRVGILDEACSHRCASLAYGRNEEGGLRCLYHGWKYDVAGNILETPPEPAESTFKSRIKQPSCLVREHAGIVWAYMGPKHLAPFFPEFEWTHYPAEQVSLAKTIQECNWAQAVEGDIDSAHTDYLHSSDVRGRPKDHAPRFEIEDTKYGYRYAAIRKPDEDADKRKWVRVTLFAAPFYTFTPPLRITRPNGEIYETATHRAYVPIDDASHSFFSCSVSRFGPIGDAQRDAGVESGYRPAGNRENMHLQDRVAMKAGNWTGIKGIRAQDRAMTESMGLLAPRYKEHLGATDLAVIRFRRRMIDAAKAFMAGGEPLGLDPSIPYHELRSEEMVVPADAHWTMVVDAPELAQA